LALHNLAGLDLPHDWPAAREKLRRGIAHQKRAASLKPANAGYPIHLRNQWIALGANALANRDPAEASIAARELAALVAGKPTELCEAAGFIARCVPLARDKAERDRYADEAIAVYRAAIAAAVPDRDHVFLATAHNTVGRVLDEVGRTTEALDSYKQSLLMLEGLIRSHPGSAPPDDALVGAHDTVYGLLDRMGRRSEALESYGKALAIRERRTRTHPDNLAYQFDLFWAYREMGNRLNEAGRSAEALRSFRDARAIVERQLRERPDSAEVASGAGILLHHLAGLDKPGDPTATLETIRQAVAHQRRAMALDPKNAACPGHLRNHLHHLANSALGYRRPTEAAAAARELATLVAGNPQELYEAARFLFRCVPLAKDKAERDLYAHEAIEMFRKVIAAAPKDAKHTSDDPDAFPLVVGAHNSIGHLCLRTGRDGEALSSYRTAREIGERLAQDRPNSAKVAGELGLALHQIAHQEAFRDRSTASATMRRAIVQTHRALKIDPESNLYLSRMNSHLIRLGGIAPAQGVPAKALEAVHHVAARMGSNPGTLYNVACILSGCVPLARNAAERDRYTGEALEALRAAVKAGWSNAPWMDRDSDFVPLHDRPEFGRIVAELFDHGFPRDPFVR
jgi:tetratricopeptide (TPR) repeat protein